jgi:pimeloyl-ACP methyl ester carboxylesterase
MRLLGSLTTLWLSAGTTFFWPSVWVQSRFWYRPSWEGRERALEESFAHYREVYGGPFVRMYFELAREQLQTSLFPIAPAIAQPTLLLWGDQDRALGMGKGVQRLASLLPNARLQVFRGVRHALAAEAPDELANAIEGFLGSPLGSSP